MSIPLDLLKDTESRALGIVVYGGPGVNKTLAIRTLVPPIRMNDFEGGSGSLMPWIRRRRKSNESQWTEYTDVDREHAFSLLLPEYRDPEGVNKHSPPAPLIDVVIFEPMRFDSYDDLVTEVGNFEFQKYNSYALDPLYEMSQVHQSYSKGAGNEYTPMQLKLWGSAQERMAIALRRIRAFRDRGVFIYFTGGEDIDKDYAVDPRSLPPGASPDQPFAIKGTVAVPGKLVGAVGHLTDIMMRARLMNGKLQWVAGKESLPGGTAPWETKDRFGRLDAYNVPDVKKLLVRMYGKDTARAIYSYTG